MAHEELDLVRYTSLKIGSNLNIPENTLGKIVRIDWSLPHPMIVQFMTEPELLSMYSDELIVDNGREAAIEWGLWMMKN